MKFAFLKHNSACFLRDEKTASINSGVEKSNSPSLDFFSVIFKLILIVSFSLAGPVQARVLNQENQESGHFKAEFLYQALVAEMYREIGNEVLAVEQYQRLALESKDPTVARRVTILAAATGQLPKGLKVAERWVALTPDDLEARQYLALLYLRNNKISQSTGQFHSIHGLVEQVSVEKVGEKSTITPSKSANIVKTSQGLTFIGSVLSVETHRDKAYRVFVEYLKQYGNNVFHKQQKLIAANLALKAKSYKAVISELENLKGLDPKNLVDASVMKAKALHKLNRLSDAIDSLQSIKDNQETSDSSRLELVRLLVLQKQKDKALPILQKLITKHHKNYDLLKSLIALQIDQGQLKRAELNIQKLRKSKTYLYDADYFSGEVLQAKGSLEKALTFYQKVDGGSFLRNAHHKVIFITRKTGGAEDLAKYFVGKQLASTKPIDKAYWSKLRADQLFEVKSYAQALVYYNKAIELAPMNTKYYYRRGLLHERMRSLDSAEKDFNQVLDIHKNDADALNALGYMLSVNTERYAEAKEYINKAHKIKPNDPIIMDSLGFVHFKTGDLSKAEKYLRKAFKLIEDPEVASHLISVLAEADKHDEARLIYQQMTDKFPDNKVLHKAKQYLQN